RTDLAYDGDGRVSSITSPEPVVGRTRFVTRYCYATYSGTVPTGCSPSASTTTMRIDGFAPQTGFARRVRYDSRSRLTERADAAGLTTTFVWDAMDRIVATTDPTALKTTRAFNDMGSVTDTWGPAPSSWFGSDQRPLSTYVPFVPHTSMRYDEGIVGLAG